MAPRARTPEDGGKPIAIVRLFDKPATPEQLRVALAVFASRRGTGQLPAHVRRVVRQRLKEGDDPREIATWVLSEVKKRGKESPALERLLANP